MLKFMALAVVGGLAVAGGYFAFQTWQDLARPDRNIVTDVVGEAAVSGSGRGRKETVIPAMKVGGGDLISTASASWVDLLLSPGLFARVKENSEVFLSAVAGTGGEVEVILRRGQVLTRLDKGRDPQQFTVVTPLVTASIRGTRLLVALGGPFQGRVTVADGTVVLRGLRAPGGEAILDDDFKIVIPWEGEVTITRQTYADQEELREAFDIVTQLPSGAGSFSLLEFLWAFNRKVINSTVPPVENFLNIPQKKARIQIGIISDAINTNYLVHQSLPEKLSEVYRPPTGDERAVDPWGNEIYYQPLNGEYYQLIAPGADGRIGTGDDIGGEFDARHLKAVPW